MSTAIKADRRGALDTESRIGAYPWPNISKHLDAHGWAIMTKLLTASECEAVAGLYGDDQRFRSHIVMARHGFGRGEYKYFSYPLPDKVADLRTALYPRLAPIANRWNASMRIDVRYPVGPGRSVGARNPLASAPAPRYLWPLSQAHRGDSPVASAATGIRPWRPTLPVTHHDVVAYCAAPPIIDIL
jgi:hypothetical protein